MKWAIPTVRHNRIIQQYVKKALAIINLKSLNINKVENFTNYNI